MTYISKTKFAEKHGFSPQYVSKLLRLGVLKEENGLLNEEESDIALAEKRAKGELNSLRTGKKYKGKRYSKQEISDASFVCLVSENFAQTNGISVGDTINLAVNYLSS